MVDLSFSPLYKTLEGDSNKREILEKHMSVSRYPNATGDAAEKLIELLLQFIPDPAPGTLEADVDLALSAYLCSAVEHVLNLPEVQRLDPATIAQAKTILRSCT